MDKYVVGLDEYTIMNEVNPTLIQETLLLVWQYFCI